MDFTTPEHCRRFLNIPELTADDLGLIEMLIGTVNGLVRNYCGWRILAQDYQRRYDGNGTGTLDIRVHPVNSVTQVLLGGVDVTADVEINDEDGELYFADGSGQVFTAGKRNVEAQFNAGYTEVPDELVHAATWLVATYYNRIRQENVGASKEKFNAIEAEYDATDLPVLVKSVLDRYRFLSVY